MQPIIYFICIFHLVVIEKKNLRILSIELSEMPLYSMGNIVRRFLVYYLVFKMCKKAHTSNGKKRTKILLKKKMTIHFVVRLL